MPYTIIGIIVFYVASLFGVGIYERSVRDTYWQEKITKDKLAAVQEARQEEHVKQEKVNAITKQQVGDLQASNNALRTQLAWVRSRANGNSADPGFIGTSPSGSRLSGTDAEFLAEFSARAAQIQSGLKACYDYADIK